MNTSCISRSRTSITRAPRPRAHICERFQQDRPQRVLSCRVPQRYCSTDELQADLDAWIKEYNVARPYQGRWCFGRPPMQIFLDAMPTTKEKIIAA